MRIVQIIFLICFLTLISLAQSGARIEGKVIPPIKRVVAILPDSPDSIKNALLKLVSSSDEKVVAETRTDDSGKFAFENMPDGNYYILGKCNYCSSPDVRTEIFRVRAGKTIKMDLHLPEQGIHEIVTISAGASQSIDEVSKTVNVISGQEMRDRADFSLVDSLRSIPGFRVQQLGGFGRTASIKTRGLRNQDTAVLIDGMRFRDASAITGDASSFLSDITLTSVDRVEVLRGSGSSLYGTNAIGGTIDFETPKPQSGAHGQISGAFGQLGLTRFRGNISDGSKDGKFGFNAAISRTVYTKGIDGDDNANNTNFQSRIEFNPTSKTNISARFFVSDAYVRLNSDPDTFGVPPLSNSAIIDARPNVTFTPDVDDPDNIQRSKFFNGQFVLTQTINTNLLFQGSYSGLRTSRKNDSGPLGVGFQSASTSDYDGTIQTANAHIVWTPGRVSTLTAGYEFEHEKYGNAGFTPDSSGNFSVRAYQSSNTFYAQELVSLFGDKLQLAGGFRAQIFDLKTPKFSDTNAPYTNVMRSDPPTAYTFDGAASYFFRRSGTKLRVHVGNGYRVPSLYERFGTFWATFLFPSQFVPIGAPDLKPERSVAADGGIEQNFLKDKVKFTAAYFYTRLTDTINYGTLPQPDPFGRDNFLSGGGYLNGKGGIARGLEFSSDVKPTRSTSVFASYTFTNSIQREPQVSGNPNIETLGIPKHQFTLVATQRIKHFWVNFDFLASNSYLAPIFSNFSFQSYVYRFKGNRRGDLTAGYTFPLHKDRMNLRLYGTMENVFDYDYFENGFRTPGRNSRVGLSFGF